MKIEWQKIPMLPIEAKGHLPALGKADIYNYYCKQTVQKTEFNISIFCRLMSANSASGPKRKVTEPLKHSHKPEGLCKVCSLKV